MFIAGYYVLINVHNIHTVYISWICHTVAMQHNIKYNT